MITTLTGCMQRASSLSALRLVAERVYHASSAVQGFGSHVSDNDPQVLHKEKTKVKTEKSTVKWAPGWNEKLASDSEAVVKAEREGHENIAELQKHTVETLHEDNVEEEYLDTPPEEDDLKRGTHPV